MSQFSLEQKAMRLAEIKKLVAKQEGKCLFKAYLGSTKKLSFKCAQGHVWTATPESIK